MGVSPLPALIAFTCMIITKITTGTVIQEFDTDKQEFVSQRFEAGDEVTYEVEGDEVNQSDFQDRLVEHSGYLAFDMVQPGTGIPGLEVAAREVVDNADDTGCSDDLTVTSAEAIEKLRDLLN